MKPRLSTWDAGPELEKTWAFEIARRRFVRLAGDDTTAANSVARQIQMRIESSAIATCRKPDDMRLGRQERGVVRNPSPILSSLLGVLYVLISSFLPFSHLLDFLFLSSYNLLP